MQHEMNHQTPPRLSPGYEGEPAQTPANYHSYGQKLSMPLSGRAPTPGQRLALAIVSLSLLVFLVLGLTFFAALDNAPNWAVLPIIFIITLFSAVVVAINLVFNRKS